MTRTQKKQGHIRTLQTAMARVLPSPTIVQAKLRNIEMNKKKDLLALLLYV